MTPAADHADAKRRAEHFVASPSFWGLDEPIDIVSRAYLSLLEAVEPLLAAAEKATPGPWEFADESIKAGETFLIGDEYHCCGTFGGFLEEPREANAAFIVQARNTASALRDLLGPTGGQA